MDFTSITAAVNGLRKATDIIRTISEANKNIEINSKVIDLQNVILALQSSLLSIQTDYAQLTSETESLRAKMATQEDWQKVESTYKLLEVSDDLFVYASLDQKHPNTAPHWLCTNCFSKRIKSILQMYNQNSMGRYYKCLNCDAHLTTRP